MSTTRAIERVGECVTVPLQGFVCRGLAIPWLVIGLLSFSTSFLANAQTEPCALKKTVSAAEPIYPPIARYAHITGVVILIASFDVDGNVIATSKVSANQMLLGRATEYVRSLKANPYTGPRNCPIVVEFRIIGVSTKCDGTKPLPAIPGVAVECRDPQHTVLTAQEACYTVEYGLTPTLVYRQHPKS